MKKLILKNISRHMKDNKFTGSSQYRFIKEKTSSIKLVAFYNENTGLADDGREVSVFYLDFSKALDIVSHKTLIKKNDEI